jgi:hypothetical protein
MNLPGNLPPIGDPALLGKIMDLLGKLPPEVIAGATKTSSADLKPTLERIAVALELVARRLHDIHGRMPYGG